MTNERSAEDRSLMGTVVAALGETVMNTRTAVMTALGDTADLPAVWCAALGQVVGEVAARTSEPEMCVKTVATIARARVVQLREEEAHGGQG